MKKNGFTLTELLAVLIVLAIIGTIATAKVVSSINVSKVKLCKNVMMDIKDAAKTWAGDNIYILPTYPFIDEEIAENLETINNGDYNEEYNTLILSLKVLQDNGYIDKDIKNPLDNGEDEEKIITPDLQVYIIYKNNNYEYKILGEDLLCSGDNK